MTTPNDEPRSEGAFGEHCAGVGAGILLTLASVVGGIALFFLIGWYMVPWILSLPWPVK